MKSLIITNVEHSNWTGEKSNIKLKLPKTGLPNFSFYDYNFRLLITEIDNDFVVELHGDEWEEYLNTFYILNGDYDKDDKENSVLSVATRIAVAYIANHV